MTSKENIIINEKDRLSVLLALASQEPAEKGACPSPEELALFIDGVLEPEKQEAILTHLDACPECYNDWLTIASVLEQKPSISLKYILEQIAKFFKNFIRQQGGYMPASSSASFKNFISQQRIYVIPAFSMATACLLIFFIWTFFQTPETGKLIAESYRMPFIQKISIGEDKSVLPWEYSAQYGFGSSNQYAPPYRSFGAGLWEGRRILTQQTSKSSEISSMPDFLSPGWDDKIKADTWEKTPWRIYFQMGKWSFLMRSVCLSDAEIPHEFRENQKHILEKIQEDFAGCSEKTQEDTNIINNKLGSVKRVIENSDKETPLNKRERIQVARELEELIKHLSPKKIPKS